METIFETSIKLTKLRLPDLNCVVVRKSEKNARSFVISYEGFFKGEYDRSATQEENGTMEMGQKQGFHRKWD